MHCCGAQWTTHAPPRKFAARFDLQVEEERIGPKIRRLKALKAA
jgi:hypothetical protein